MVVLTYNIWDGGGERLGHIADVIRSQRPDAVAIVEATRGAVEELARGLELDFAFGDAVSSPLHVAWLSHLPIERVRNHRSAVFAKTLLEIEVNGIVLLATHLASRHEGGTRRRIAEVQEVVEVLRTVADRPRLLVGDLNALQPEDQVGEPPPGVRPRGEAALGAPRTTLEPFTANGDVDCYRRFHPEDPGYTYTAEWPWLRLDYAFASPTLAPRIRACDVVRTDEAAAASDHLPLRVEIAERSA